MFLCIRTVLRFSCTSQEQEAEIEVVEEEEEEEQQNPAPLTGSQTLRPKKWLTKETIEQISTYGILSLVKRGETGL